MNEIKIQQEKSSIDQAERKNEIEDMRFENMYCSEVNEN